MAPRGKVSAGLLVFRGQGASLEVLLVHPGGPFWSKRDAGAWFMPKGELERGEEPLVAALREFREELGLPPPEGDPLPLGTAKNKGGKLIHAWALPGELDLGAFRSNTFTLEWPPRSGKQREFPEVDRAEYFGIEVATQKMNEAELPLLQRLLEELR